MRSTSRPPTSVPIAPATSIAVNAVLPAASVEESSWTNQSGTNDCRPKYTPERSEITPPRRVKAFQSSSG